MIAGGGVAVVDVRLQWVQWMNGACQLLAKHAFDCQQQQEITTMATEQWHKKKTTKTSPFISVCITSGRRATQLGAIRRSLTAHTLTSGSRIGTGWTKSSGDVGAEQEQDRSWARAEQDLGRSSAELSSCNPFAIHPATSFVLSLHCHATAKWQTARMQNVWRNLDKARGAEKGTEGWGEGAEKNRKNSICKRGEMNI